MKDNLQKRFDKESVYDNEIYPLMDEIIKICQREGIPVAATFIVKDDGELGPVFCNTIIDGKSVDQSIPGLETIKKIRNVLIGKHMSMIIQLEGDR